MITSTANGMIKLIEERNQLRRALEKACVEVQALAGSCPNDQNEWEWEQGCASACVVNGDAINSKNCWMAYFMEADDE